MSASLAVEALDSPFPGYTSASRPCEIWGDGGMKHKSLLWNWKPCSVCHSNRTIPRPCHLLVQGVVLASY